jgi:ABC-type phosphate transport system substrate-binding protein
MHRLRQLTAGIAIAATAAIAAATVPALADPIGASGKAVTPQSYDIVSVGADTDQYLFDQLSADYDKTIPAKLHSAKLPWLYSWDATGTAKIATKKGCAPILRPNGGNAGLKALDANAADGKTGSYCIDFARTSSGRSSTAPPKAAGGVAFVALAEDAVTYAIRDVAPKGQAVTYAPHNLSLAQLKSIYLCSVTTWGQVGGTAGQPIKAYLPQAGAATTTFFLKALGITSPGSCVNQSLEQNQGLSKQFNSPNAIFIYSVGDWLAQKYHSPLPGHKPTGTQNKFGSDDIGYLGLGKINGVSPIVKTTAGIVINKKFKSTGFTRKLYDIVRFAKTKDDIPASLDRILGRSGYFCANTTATKAIESYGFVPALTCGTVS